MVKVLLRGIGVAVVPVYWFLLAVVQPLSFPRRRESRPFKKDKRIGWIPASAGMTKG
jgi:hypothetical protein